MADYTPNTTFTWDGSTYSVSTLFDFTIATGDPVGTFAVTLEGASGALSGAMPVIGDFAVTLDDITPSITGEIPVAGTLDVTLDDVTASLVGDIPVMARVDVTLEGATGIFDAYYVQNRGYFQNIQLDNCLAGVIGNYDPNVTRFIKHENLSIYEDVTLLPPVQTCFPKEQGIRIDHHVFDEQLDGTFMFHCTTMVKEQGIFIPRQTCFDYQDATFLSDLSCFPYEQGTRIDITRESVYEDASYSPESKCAVLQQMTKVYPDRWEVIYQDSNRPYDFLHPVMLVPFPPHDFIPDMQVEFTDTDYIPTSDFEFNFGRPSNLVVRQIHGVFFNDFNSNWDEGTFTDIKRCVIVEETKYPDRGKTQWIDYPRDIPDPNPPSGSTHTVPVQEVYNVLNTIVSTLDDDLTVVQLNNINFGIDADSSAWTFSADLVDPSEIGLVKQLPDGTAITLHITINTYVWHVLVEKIQINRIFGNQSVKISGRGLTGLLSKPYEQPVSVNVGVGTDIRVIVDNILPLGWNDLGDLYWLLGDAPIASPVWWTVDAGAYSYQNKTSIEAIKGIADDIGVMLVPSRDSQEIYFKSRYPVLPWNFGTVAVDVAIPDSAIVQLTEEPVSSFQANGVYVHGDEIGGELAFVRLNGTAGDRLAPTVNNSLMVDVVALRSLGERILSGQYAQPTIKSITTFMDGTTVPLLELGDYVGLTVDAVETKGIVNSVQVFARFGEVTQTIQIGESTPNTWVAFTEILPKDPMLVATLTSTDGTTSLMTLIDGGVVRVRGTGTPTAKYYIQGGEIVGIAPNLTSFEIVL